MKQITTIGLDLAKQIFQVHAADAGGDPIFAASSGEPVLRFRRRRRPVWSGWRLAAARITGLREISALGRRAVTPITTWKPFGGTARPT